MNIKVIWNGKQFYNKQIKLHACNKINNILNDDFDFMIILYIFYWDGYVTSIKYAKRYMQDKINYPRRRRLLKFCLLQNNHFLINIWDKVIESVSSVYLN